MRALFLLTSLVMTAFCLPAQDIKRFLGEYTIEADCVKDGTPETVTFDIKMEKDEETEFGIQFRLGLPAHFVYGRDVKATVLNDLDFIIPEQILPGPISGAIFSGEGNINLRGDSIFMQYSSVVSDYSYIIECNCKGKKTSSPGSIPSLSSGKNRIYVDATRQVIVIDETLQNQSLIVELINLQGSTIWKKTNAGESISIANLPSGIYLCRIFQDGKIIYSGKILKR